MRERSRPDHPRSCQSRRFCFRRRNLGVTVLLAAAGTVGCWGVSAFRRRYYPRDAREAPLRSTEARDEKSTEQRLLQCYSTPEADPFEGRWRSCANGVEDSPANMVGWEFPTSEFGFLAKCQNIWNKRKRVEGETGPRPYWAWEPTKCSLDAVSEEKLCRVLEGRKGLLLVGDSLTRLSTTTLASILRAKSLTADLYKDDWEACGGKVKLRFMRNDVLDTRTKPRYRSVRCEESVGGALVNNTRCRIFATDATLREFDTLVVNSGAHPRPAAEFGREMEASAKALTSSMKRLHGEDKAILVVRNTVPGHWGCTERMFDAPVNKTIALKLVAEAPDSYEWDSFESRNVQLQKAFSPDRGWTLLDAYSPTLLRPDSHIGNSDCLHYCIPGPADHWALLLYNILLVAKNDSA
ncbi:unnamed protein product [Ectocarpus sp. CCAP 1310/34]|nr:unnamed protein product [Ectocarpus sp. CCAP 1310/34]